MQYMMMFYVHPDDAARAHGPEAEASMAGWVAYIGSLYQAGVGQSGHGLLPPATATTVRVRGDQRQVQDGPFADSKEQLGGYMIIEVPDLDAALAWAARAPCAARGAVEVRPVMPQQVPH